MSLLRTTTTTVRTRQCLTWFKVRRVGRIGAIKGEGGKYVENCKPVGLAGHTGGVKGNYALKCEFSGKCEIPSHCELMVMLQISQRNGLRSFRSREHKFRGGKLLGSDLMELTGLVDTMK